MPSVTGLFSSMNGIQMIFILGFIPDDDEFYELTPDQYQYYYSTAASDNERSSDEKVYMLLPKDHKKYAEFASGDVMTFTEKQIGYIKWAQQVIENYRADSGKEFNDFEEILRYCASIMPPVFTEGTKYERYHKKT